MIKGFNEILRLCQDKCLDKQAYINILESMEKPPLYVTEHVNSLYTFLNDLMNSDYDYLVNHVDNLCVRLKFGEQFVYRDLWYRIKSSNIGHLSSFKYTGGRWEIVIRVNPSVYKGTFESIADYQARKAKFDKEFPYELMKTKVGSQIKDTPENRSKLREWVDSFLTHYYYKEEILNGFVNQLKIYATDIVPFGYTVERPKEFTQAILEEIEKTCREVIDAVAMASEHESLIPSVMSNASSSYYHICRELDYENDYCLSYMQKTSTNRNRNTAVEERSKKLGKSVSLEEMGNTANEVFDKVEKKFLKDLCLWICETSWHDGSLFFRGRFSKDSAMFCPNILKDGFRFDEYNLATDDRDYKISADCFKEVESVLKKDYGCYKVSILIEDIDGNLCINEISGYISDLKYLAKVGS